MGHQGALDKWFGSSGRVYLRWVTWHLWTPLFYDFSFGGCFWNIGVLDQQLHKSPVSIQELLRSLLGIPPHVIGPRNQGITKVGSRKTRDVLPLEKSLPRNTALSSEWFVIEIVAETILNKCSWKSEMHSNEYCNFKHVWVTWHVWTPLFFDLSFWSCFCHIAVCTNTYVIFLIGTRVVAIAVEYLAAGHWITKSSNQTYGFPNSNDVSFVEKALPGQIGLSPGWFLIWMWWIPTRLRSTSHFRYTWPLEPNNPSSVPQCPISHIPDRWTHITLPVSLNVWYSI